MNKSIRLLVYISMLVAQGVVIGILERAIPSPFSFAPGAKLGLSNLVTIISLFTLPIQYSFQVVLLRVVLTMLLGGTVSTFLYSITGAILSYVVMLLLKCLGPRRVSIVGISVMGGVMHNVGQLFMAALLARSWSVLNYLPVLSLSGMLAGIAVGLVGNFLLNRVTVLKMYHYELVKTKHQQLWLSKV